MSALREAVGRYQKVRQLDMYRKQLRLQRGYKSSGDYRRRIAKRAVRPQVQANRSLGERLNGMR